VLWVRRAGDRLVCAIEAKNAPATGALIAGVSDSSGSVPAPASLQKVDHYLFERPELVQIAGVWCTHVTYR
jgi:hypothetical protein